MSNLRTAAQQALEALEALQGGCTDHDDGTVEAITVWCPEIITALKAALAEPVKEADYSVCPTCGGLASDPIVPEALRAALAEPVQEPDVPATNFGNMAPVGWLESPRGAFRANPLYKIQFPSQLLSWQVPVFTALAEPVQEPDPTYKLIGCVQHDCEECQRRTRRPAEPVGVVTSMVKGGVTWQRWPADMPDGTRLFGEVQP